MIESRELPMEQNECRCTAQCGFGFNPNCSCQHEMCQCTDMTPYIGAKRVEAFQTLDKYITEAYQVTGTWVNGGKKWDYGYRYRIGSNTLGAFYMKKDQLGFLLIFGKDERQKVEAAREKFSGEVLEIYDTAKTYHDGKWVMFDINDSSSLADMKQLLTLKRKPK